MKNKLTFSILAALVLALVFSSLGAQIVFAQEEPTTFFLSAYHFVKGDEIGLTREAPVNISIIKDGQTIGIVHLEYRQRVQAELPGGIYELKFNDAETGATLFSCGPYDIANGDHVRLQAHEQGAGRVPTCYVSVK